MSSQRIEDYPIWTIPNTISFLRLTVLLPLSLGLLASAHYGWSLVALFFWGISDALDGYLARRLDQMSPLGAELDPISDRFSILIIAVALVFGGLLPWYLFLAMLAVDGFLFVLALLWFGGYPTVSVNFMGKMRTALLMLGLPMLVLAAALGSEPLRVVALGLVWVGVVGHVLTGISYVAEMVKIRAEGRQRQSELPV
ncbi:CDP-alcohol phosphatidyltransferase family protein [Actinomycetaceae bacterium MB13-C1-2]|nr:CDP-alcohol phosphatidyltransferase family protein [Actinomycetaceae bacterium MB13-C1-2]